MKSRVSRILEIQPYLRDHFFEGRAVFPAVETMILLARAVRDAWREIDVTHMTDASFSRLLALSPEANRIEVQIDIEPLGQGIRASLSTTVRLQAAGLSRTLEHARATFGKALAPPETPPSYREAQKLDGPCISVPASSIYRELIPFGRAFQNILGDLAVSEAGAIAEISGGAGVADDTVLGSPFVLDAAMHAACVWSQRYKGIVAFPVGVEKRIVHTPTQKGASYLARIVPVAVSLEPFRFDAWIYDQSGVLCETIGGLQMRDVTQGRIRPPQWIKEPSWTFRSSS